MTHNKQSLVFGLALLLLLCSAITRADEYDDTIKVFKEAGQSGEFFKMAYGYAVFPTNGKAGMGIGGARGTGRVYEQGKHVGEVTMTQLTAGLQLGGQAFSQIIFFENKAAFDEFTGGNFEFGAQASAIAVQASASAGASTTGASAGASAGKEDATTA